MSSNAALFATIDRWIENGWLTQLNRAFARFLLDLDPQASTEVLWAGTLLSHQLDRGEVFLDLKGLTIHPSETLAIPGEEAWHSKRELGQLELSIFNQFSLNHWLTKLTLSPLINSGKGATPMVLDGSRLYLRRFWEYQQTLNLIIAQKLKATRESLPEALHDSIRSLFSAPMEQPDWQKIACVLALRSRFSIITGGPGTGKTTTLTKLLTLLIQVHQLEGNTEEPTILLAAPTGKAAARVSESIAQAIAKLQVDDKLKRFIPQQASTLHRLLGSRQNSRLFIHNRHNPLPANIVIVDEASMIDLEMMSSLLEALQDKTQLILLGDKDQLASVEAGAVMGDLCRKAELAAYDSATRAWIQRYAETSLPRSEDSGTPINQQTVMLRYSHRFNAQSGIGLLAKAVNTAQVKDAKNILSALDDYADLCPAGLSEYQQLRQQPNPQLADSYLKHLVCDTHPFVNSGKRPPTSGYAHYLALIRAQRPQEDSQFDSWGLEVLKAFDEFQVLCAVRRGYWGVESINQRIEQWLFGERTPRLWYEGRAVMITRNDYNLGLMNGDVGIVLRGTDSKLKVVFADNNASAPEKIRWISPIRLPEVETAFAITVHKSQGSEFAQVALVLPEARSPVISRELVYTAITRAKEKFILIESGCEVFEQAIQAGFNNIQD